MLTNRLGAISLLLVGVSGCTPPPSPTAPQTPLTIATATAPPTTSASAAVPAVSEPTDIATIARFKNPIGTFTNLASCAGIAPIIVEVNARLMLDRILTRTIGGPDVRRLSGLVAIDAPVDALVALDPQTRPRPPFIGFSIGLTSLDGAKAAISNGGELEVIGGDMWRIRSNRGIACGVAPSVGATAARLVCSRNEASLLALAPYMAKGLPSVDLGTADYFQESRINVARKRYGSFLQNFTRSLPGAIQAEYGINNERFDRLLFESADAVREDAVKLLDDVQTIRFEARSARSDTCLKVNASIELGSKTAWLAATLSDRLERSAPPPAIYFRQPKDSLIALYSRGIDAARFATILPKAKDIVDALLASEAGISAADRKKVTDLLDVPLKKETHSVFSYGVDNLMLPSDTTSKAGQKKAIETSYAKIVGWTLIGMDEGADAARKQMKNFVTAFNAPGLQTQLKKNLAPSEVKLIPTVKSATAPSTLGAGAEAVEISFTNIDVKDFFPRRDASAGALPKVTLKYYLLLMADGDSTWVGMGANKDELVKRLLASKTGAPDKDQLATRSDLGVLQNGKQMAGGFISMAPATRGTKAMGDLFAAIEPSWVAGTSQTLVQALGGLPNRGQTPIFLTMNGIPGETTQLQLEVDVQQGSLEDAKTLAIGGYSFFSQMGLIP